VSTHSQALHQQVIGRLEALGYRIEISSDFEHHTSAYDGLVCATHPACPALFDGALDPMSREQIAGASAPERLAYLQRVARLCGCPGPDGSDRAQPATAPRP
jgi:hypothetical protein